MSYKYLLDFALILMSTKILGLITRQFRMPQVVGALLAGLLLGPAMLGVLTETDMIHNTAELGVIVLMFCAGMETDIDELKRSGSKAFVIALLGVLVPVAGGFGVACYFNTPERILSDAGSSIFLQNVFIGVILTATSVSITVETLKEMGKLKTRSGNAILGAAIIDDILGIVALTIITSMADPNVHIALVLAKTAAFFVFSVVVGIIFHKVYKKWSESADRGLHRHAIAAFVFCLLMAYVAEEWFGVADITGAFLAGLIVSKTQRTQFLASTFDTLSYLYLSPVFFTSIGLKVDLPEMTPALIGFSAALALVAILTKVIGCGLGAKLCGYKNYQSIRIGVGMISRGEVALIVASKGMELGLLGSNFLGPVVIVVVITTIITPILLKPAFRIGPNISTLPAGVKGFASNYEEVAKIRSGHKEDVQQ